jgi:septal ring factor EnvC (AmiA/AmiB activator)
MTQTDELVKELRKINNDLACLAADAIESQSAELTRLRERNVELERDLEEAQRNYLNVKGWWTGERQSRHKHEANEAGMRTEIEEQEARIASLEATARELREALRAINIEGEGVKHYAELEGLKGGALPSSVHIKADCITYIVRTALAASESVVGKSEGENDGVE